MSKSKRQTLKETALILSAVALAGATALPGAVAQAAGSDTVQIAACNPCNPCNPCAAANPCNPCNPCAAN